MAGACNLNSTVMMIEIYSKTECPYCHMAKRHLSEHGISYTETLYDDFAKRQAMYDTLGLQGSQRTVPQVFLVEHGQRERIGGYRELLQSDVIARHAMGGFDAEF